MAERSDRQYADVAASAQGRSWPVADATVAGPMVRNWRKFRHQLQTRLTVVGGTTVARTRRPLSRKAAVTADMLRRLYLIHGGHQPFKTPSDPAPMA